MYFTMTAGDKFFNFVWCLKVTEAYDCNLKFRNGFNTTKSVRNDILHLIIEFLVKKLFLKMAAGGHL